jgi:hypothetical protein
MEEARHSQTPFGRRHGERSASARLFSAEDIIDAPEHHDYARAMGLLTWGTWDPDVRPLGERVNDFLQAYPANDPALFQGSMLAKTSTDEYGPATAEARILRTHATDNSFGTLPEILARYGLKQSNGPQYLPTKVDVPPFRAVTRVRNQRLRTLYGRVDVEAANMDEAKAAEIERLERKRAAEQIRNARAQMRRDIGEGE